MLLARVAILALPMAVVSKCVKWPLLCRALDQIISWLTCNKGTPDAGENSRCRSFRPMHQCVHVRESLG